MSRRIVLCEIKKHKTEISLFEIGENNVHRVEIRGTYPVNSSGNYPTKKALTSSIGDFLTSNKITQPIHKKVIVACFNDNSELKNSLELKISSCKFNNSIFDSLTGLTFIDKHELLAFTDFSQTHYSFELNSRPVLSGHRTMVVLVGKHLRCYEQHLSSKKLNIDRLELGEMHFSPHNDFDHEFASFVRKESIRSMKFKEIISKNGLKMAYLFHVNEAHGSCPKEPSFDDLLRLISEKDELAIKGAEYFIRLMAHCIYVGLILLMPNSELILIGSFLPKVIAAFNNDDRVRQIFMKHVILANHVKPTFENLRMDVPTDMNQILVQSLLKNF